MLASKLTKKYQATIPKEVREILHLHGGDVIKFEVNNQNIILKKATPMDIEFAKTIESSLDEWNSVHDEEAYRDL